MPVLLDYEQKVVFHTTKLSFTPRTAETRSLESDSLADSLPLRHGLWEVTIPIVERKRIIENVESEVYDRMRPRASRVPILEISR